MWKAKPLPLPIITVPDILGTHSCWVGDRGHGVFSSHMFKKTLNQQPVPQLNTVTIVMLPHYSQSLFL